MLDMFMGLAWWQFLISCIVLVPLAMIVVTFVVIGLFILYAAIFQ